MPGAYIPAYVASASQASSALINAGKPWSDFADLRSLLQARRPVPQIAQTIEVAAKTAAHST